MKIFIDLWNWISFIGIQRVNDPEVKRNVILTNRMVLTIFILMSAYFIIHFSQWGWNTFNRSLLIGNFFSITVIYSLNRLGLSSISRVILSLMLSVYPFYSSLNSKIQNIGMVEEVMYFSPRIFIIVTSIVPVLIFSLREKRALTISLMGSFVPLLFFDTIHNKLNVGYYQIGFESSQYASLTLTTFFSYIIFLSASIFFKRVNENYERKNLELIESLETKNAELGKKNKKIKNQAIDLEVANREIQLINNNLEQFADKRTKKLIDQAIQFQKFSFKNSHELRAPLTNVMSIIQLLKVTESDAEMNELLVMLDRASIDLDGVVHEINELLHKASIDLDRSEDS